jgi:hypothetical protein
MLGYSGYVEVEIFSNRWRPPDDVLNARIVRFRTVV